MTRAPSVDGSPGPALDSFAERVVLPEARSGLKAGEIHVWHVNIIGSSEVSPTETVILSPEELSRAARFRSATERDAFVARRLWLRRILSGYAGASPADLTFTTSSTGKRELLEPGKTGLHFSASRSDSLALYAVARDKAVGIDVETLERGFESDLAVWIFGREGAEEMRRVPPIERERRLLGRWCLIEALAKGTGVGLALIDKGVRLPIPDADFPSLLRLEGRPWTTGRIPTAGGFIAALAVEGRARRVLHLSPRLMQSPGPQVTGRGVRPTELGLS